MTITHQNPSWRIGQTISNADCLEFVVKNKRPHLRADVEKHANRIAGLIRGMRATQRQGYMRHDRAQLDRLCESPRNRQKRLTRRWPAKRQ